MSASVQNTQISVMILPSCRCDVFILQ